MDEVPDSARPVARIDGRIILAEGEATGHAHAIRSSGATLLADDDERYLRVIGPGHRSATRSTRRSRSLPGTYRVVIQREYVPAEISPVAFRRVVD